jgi:hypothetical protein
LSITKNSKKEQKLNLKISKSRVGTISCSNKKLGCPSWSIPTEMCKTGSKLAKKSKNICSKCYARNMTNFRSNIHLSWSRNYDKWLNMNSEKEWIESMIYQINYACNKMNTNYFRIFVGGDYQNKEMINSFIKIAKKMPHIFFWAPSKEYQLLKNIKRVPKNMIIRVSNPLINPRYTHSGHKNTSTSFTKNSHIKLGLVCEEDCKKCGYACWDKSVKNITYIVH